MESSDMIDTENKMKKCLKIKYDVLNPLNIVYNLSNSNVLFWNKYQLFLYEHVGNEETSKYIVPKFQIQQVIAFNNWIICLDTCGNVHTTTLKFKSSDLTKISIAFQPRSFNVLALIPINENNILTVKHEYNEYYLSIHKANIEFQVIKKIQLDLSIDDRVLKPVADNIIFTSTPLLKNKHRLINELFQIETNFEDLSLNIISFDKKTVFCCVTSKLSDEQIKPLKLYTCPSKICDIKVEINDEYIHVFIGLTVGTVIIVPLYTKVPNIIYLNTALHRFKLVNKSLVYTDGNNMWKAEDILNSIKFKQLILKDVNDFIFIGDWVVATTFNNIIYSLNEDKCSQNNEDNEYNSAERILNNIGYLDEILLEVDKIKQLSKKIDQEKNYLTALSLSNRQDLVLKMVKCQILVYEDYREAVNDKSDFVLTESLKEYFKPNTILFGINIDMSELKNNFEKILNHVKSPKIHLTFESLGKNIKCNSICIKIMSNVTNILVPIQSHRIFNQIEIHIKFILRIPGVYDEKSSTWSTLYSKSFILKSEQFIKYTNFTNNLLLKQKTPIENLIVKTALNHHGSLFKFKNETQSHITWSLYIQLPEKYANIFQEANIFSQHLGTEKANRLSQKFKSSDFLQSKTTISFDILNKIVTLEIFKEEFTNIYNIKITSGDAAIAHNIRSFLIKSLKMCHVGEAESMFVDSKLYTVTENLQKQLRDSISKNSEDLMSLLEEFNKNVLSVGTV